MNVAISPDIAVLGMLIFARMGVLIMLMPGMGERSISARLRLAFALLITLLLYPVIKPSFDTKTISDVGMLTLLFTEIGIGLILGLTIRLISSVMTTAGIMIAQYLGLSFATMVDPNIGGQGTSISVFLSLLGVALIMATDLHYLAIKGLIDSYELIKFGSWPAIEDVSTMFIKGVSSAFVIAMQISAPFLIVSLVFNVSLGLVAKMMPQMQVFFIAMPLSIGIGLLMMFAFLTAMMSAYMNYYHATLSQFLVK